MSEFKQATVLSGHGRESNVEDNVNDVITVSANRANPRNANASVAHLRSHQQPPAPPSNLGRSTTLAQPAVNVTQPFRLGEFQCVQKYQAAMAAAAHHAAAAQRLIAAQSSHPQSQQSSNLPPSVNVNVNVPAARAQSLGPMPTSATGRHPSGGLLPPYIPSPVQLASPVVQPQGAVRVGSASATVGSPPNSNNSLFAQLMGAGVHMGTMGAHLQVPQQHV